MTTDFAPPPRRISLALPGGGSFGAYGWGVIEFLLERDRFEIAGVTGASAGAINAALLGDGFARGGAAGACSLLESFWMRLARECRARRRSRLRGALRMLRESWSQSNRVVHDLAIRAMADFEIDPATMEPLRGLLGAILDPGSLANAPFPVFVNATAVCGFELRVFGRDEIDANVLCASSCVPLLFEAVEVDGVAYWDGGFLGNPALFPVIEHCDSSDIVLVATSPQWDSVPSRAGDLLARIGELGFAAALRRERRAIDFVSQLVRDADHDLRSGLREIRVHEVPAHPDLCTLRIGAFEASEDALRHLRTLGREAAQTWLDTIGPVP